jgi:hypothetical protein
LAIPPSGRREESEAPQRDPYLSLWQSAAKELGLQATPSSPGVDALASSVELMSPVLIVSQLASAGSSQEALGVTVGEWADDCARTASRFLWAEIHRDHAAASGFADELKKSECDPRWAECLKKYLLYKATGGHFPYRDHEDRVIELKDPVRLAIVGDWGTGDPIAVRLLESIRSLRPDLLLHLGDIYYSGTDEETKRNFLDPSHSVMGQRFPLFSLCGNHDMYSGGDGYYRLLDAIGQRASYFCLRNKHWQLLAMDTGHNDCDPLTVATSMTSLNGTETPWHLNRILNPEGRRTILLSHHPLFSAFGAVGKIDGTDFAYNPNLYSAFGEVLDRVEWWFWGHEHTLAVYEAYMGLQRGRCVGCSAVPVFKNQQSYQTNRNLKTLNPAEFPAWKSQAELGIIGDDYAHAFALLTLSAQKALVEYYQSSADGGAALLWKESHDFARDPGDR